MGEKALQNYSWKTILTFHYSRLCIFWKSCLLSRYCCKFITAIKKKMFSLKNTTVKIWTKRKTKEKKKPKNKKLKITSRGYVTMYLKVEIFCAGLSFNLIFSFFRWKTKKKTFNLKNNKGKGFSHSPEGNFPGGKFSSKGVGKGKMGDFFLSLQRAF